MASMKNKPAKKRRQGKDAAAVALKELLIAVDRVVAVAEALRRARIDLAKKIEGSHDG